MPNDVLNDGRIGRLIELALMEDIGLGDITTEATVPENQLAKGELLCKEAGVVAGLEVAALVFGYCDHSITLSPAVADGGVVRAGQIVAQFDGDTRSLLRGERTALNFLQRMSGIATLTRRYVEKVAGTNARITDTRKTVPGLRVLDKWAVRLGGGVNHRFGLDDMVLIKDNHIVAAGGIRNAVARCVSYLQREGPDAGIEVETKDLEEVREALQCEGVKRIMLDNFTIANMQNAVELIEHRVEVEASGGITFESVRSVAETGVDFISVGALTHSVKALDLSLEITHTQL
jgi:nicotinate-nucleotide pyrophosphorylase (carboxylating)